jgi:hypothetical protein
MSGQVVLYDLPNKASKTTWTMNAWKGQFQILQLISRKR